jgi:hypothetical protein
VILIQRLAGAVLGILLFVLAFVFTSVILAVAAAVALLLFAWLWWRTRNLPKRGRGTVIEGEYRVESETRRIDDDTR